MFKQDAAEFCFSIAAEFGNLKHQITIIEFLESSSGSTFKIVAGINVTHVPIRIGLGTSPVSKTNSTAQV